MGEQDFRVFSASRDGTLRLWDPAGLRCLRVYSASAAAGGPRGGAAAAAGGGGGGGASPPRRGARSGSPAIAPPAAGGTSAARPGGGAHLDAVAAGCGGGGLSEVAAATFYEAWNVLVSGHEGGELALWNVATGAARVLHGHTDTVACMDMGFLLVRIDVPNVLQTCLTAWSVPGNQCIQRSVSSFFR